MVGMVGEGNGGWKTGNNLGCRESGRGQKLDGVWSRRIRGWGCLKMGFWSRGGSLALGDIFIASRFVWVGCDLYVNWYVLLFKFVLVVFESLEHVLYRHSRCVWDVACFMSVLPLIIFDWTRMIRIILTNIGVGEYSNIQVGMWNIYNIIIVFFMKYSICWREDLSCQHEFI